MMDDEKVTVSQVGLLDASPAPPRGCVQRIVGAVPDFVTKASWLETIPVALRRGRRRPRSSRSSRSPSPRSRRRARRGRELVRFFGRVPARPRVARARGAASSRRDRRGDPRGVRRALAVGLRHVHDAVVRVAHAPAAARGDRGASPTADALAPAHAIAATIRFPALAQTTLTVVLWWLVLTPLITYQLLGTPGAADFRRFNFALFAHGASVQFAGRGGRVRRERRLPATVRPVDLARVRAGLSVLLPAYADRNDVHLSCSRRGRRPAFWLLCSSSAFCCGGIAGGTRR